MNKIINPQPQPLLDKHRCDLCISNSCFVSDKKQIFQDLPRVLRFGNISGENSIQSAVFDSGIGSFEISQDVENEDSGLGQSRPLNSDEIESSIQNLFVELEALGKQQDVGINLSKDPHELESHCSASNKEGGCKPNSQKCREAELEFEHEGICKDTKSESKGVRTPNGDLKNPVVDVGKEALVQRAYLDEGQPVTPGLDEARGWEQDDQLFDQTFDEKLNYESLVNGDMNEYMYNELETYQLIRQNLDDNLDEVISSLDYYNNKRKLQDSVMFMETEDNSEDQIYCSIITDKPTWVDNSYTSNITIKHMDAWDGKTVTSQAPFVPTTSTHSKVKQPNNEDIMSTTSFNAMREGQSTRLHHEENTPWKTATLTSPIDITDQIPSVNNFENSIQSTWLPAEQKIQYESVLTDDYCAFNNYISSGLEPSNKILPVFKPEERYDAIKLAVRTKVQDEKAIVATYLWSEECAEHTVVNDQPKGIIRLSTSSTTTGDLIDGTKVYTLIDTGATKNFISTKFIEKHELIQSYPVMRIKNVSISMANDQKETVNKMTTFNMYLGGHLFEFTAYIMDCSDSFDFVLGMRSLFELEAKLDISNLIMEFEMRTLPLICTRSLKILPHKHAFIPLEIDNMPSELNHTNTEFVAKLTQGLENKLLRTLTLQLDHGRINIKTENLSEGKVIQFNKGDILGYVDMRSLGYFYVPRIGIQQCMKYHFHFLSDHQMDEFFNFIQNKAFRPPLRNRYPAKMDKDTNLVQKNDPYPWLDQDDPRREMSDLEILKTYVKLDEAHISDAEKEEAYQIMLRNKNAFSLRDEIGVCPYLQVHLDVIDKTPFYVRPFPASESDKKLIDAQMKKGCLLGIMKKGMSSYSSPIMLIPRKLGGIPRIVTDFRLLNSRLVRLNPSIPLVRDAIQILGNSKVDLLSVIDLRDAYHTLRLDEDSQQYCAITPYYGSPTYKYLRLAMGLAPSPAVWMEFITAVVDKLPNKEHYLAIMDDCLIHSDKKSHMHHLENFFKAIQFNGLKISPKKCQLFRKEIVYMGHTILVKDHGACITPLRSNIDPIMKLTEFKTPKDCKSFCGMVNFLAMYLPKLQEYLVPIYKLTRKGVKFEWSEECQKNFEIIKSLLVKPPILTTPKPIGRFTLVSDTCIIACGATLYQEQLGRNRLIAYASKSLPEPVKNYSISELELCGLAVNIKSFGHLLKNVDFDVWVDHSALVHIVRGKKEPPTLRIMKLLEVLRGYSFTLHFMNGKSLKVTDFLSRFPTDGGENTREIIPIAFHIKDYDSKEVNRKLMAYDSPSHWCDTCKHHMTWDILCAMCNVMTRKQTKEQGITLPSVKPFSLPNNRPEKQSGDIQTPVPTPPTTPTALQPPTIPTFDDLKNLVPKNANNPQVYPPLKQQPLLPPPMIQPMRPGLLLPSHTIPLQRLSQEILKPGVEESDDVQVSDDFLRPPEESMYRRPITLVEKIRDSSIFRKHIPRQSELDKYLEIMKKKIIHDYQLPITLQELQAEYQKSPYFKDIYKYVKTEIIHFQGKAATIFKIMCQDYLIIEGLLFKLNPYKSKGDIKLDCLLCIPERYIPSLLYQYHNTFLSSHQGVIKMYHTLREKYYFPHMMDCIRRYILSCHNCQSTRARSDDLEITYARIPLDFKPMQRFSMDIKHMPPGKMGMKYILFCTCECTSYVEAIPISEIKSDVIANALYTNIICRYGRVRTIIMDQATYFTSELMNSVFTCLNIRPIVVSPENHGSNRTERYIKTLNDMMCKHLTGIGETWPMYVKPICYAMNTFVNPITGFSPHELVYLTEPPDPLGYEFDFNRKDLSVPVSQYLSFMKYRQNIIRNILQDKLIMDKLHKKILAQRSHPSYSTFCVGDLVFIKAPTASSLITPSRKFKIEWIGPLKIHSIIDATHYMVSDLKGAILPIPFHIRRLKIYHYNMNEIDDDTLLTFDNIEDLLQYLQKPENKGGEGDNVDNEKKHVEETIVNR